VRRATGLDATSLTARHRRAATVGAQRRPLKGIPNRYGIHLTNVFSFNELTKVSPCVALRKRPEALRRQLEFGTPRELRVGSRRAMPPAPGCDTLGYNACLAALHNTFATFTMRRRTTPHTSRVAEPDDQPPKYGLRKRTAHQTVSDDKSHEDAPRHQSPPKRLKRTSAFSSAHSPSSRGPAKNRTMKGLGRRRTRKDESKAWSAEAILEESDSQYLIKYEPVEEGAQCEISWQPKCNANEALVAWWEERKMEMVLENGSAERDNVPDLPSEGNETRQRYIAVESDGRPQKSVAGLLSQEQHDGKSEDFKQHTVKLFVDKHKFRGNEELVENTLLKPSTTIVPKISTFLCPRLMWPSRECTTIASLENFTTPRLWR
jgi:hypothetical protein